MDIDRGPDWLFIRLRPPLDDAGQSIAGHERPLAETVWKKLEQCFCYRVVLELEDVRYLPSWMIGELVRLHKRVTTQGGMLRLSGLSAAAQEVLHISRLADRFPQYRDRTEAVMGYRPPQAR
jgi:anti-anti-sigma factor